MTEDENRGSGRPGDIGRVGGRDDGDGNVPRPIRERFHDALYTIRTRPSHHFVAMLVTAFVGLFLVWLHWFGLVLAGALVGIVSPSLRNGVFSALGFGILVIALFLLSHGTVVPRVLGMEPIIYITLLSALVLPMLGSLVRGLESEI